MDLKQVLVIQAEEIYERVHENIFGKSAKGALMWSELKKDPLEGFKTTLFLGQAPLTQTMQTGFLMGVCLAHAVHTRPDSVLPFLNMLNIRKMTADVTPPRN